MQCAVVCGNALEHSHMSASANHRDPPQSYWAGKSILEISGLEHRKGGCPICPGLHWAAFEIGFWVEGGGGKSEVGG